MIAHGGRRNSRGGSRSPSLGAMASASSSHQNAAKKIKALLRRTHFPVARLRQLPVTSSSLTSGPSATAGTGGNPWDGIVSGDPRAALVVLHWTLLDMSPLFASLLLDRDYAELNSLTDFKFVSTTLRMLRDEFSCRPQLTVRKGRGGEAYRRDIYIYRVGCMPTRADAVAAMVIFVPSMSSSSLLRALRQRAPSRSFADNNSHPNFGVSFCVYLSTYFDLIFRVMLPTYVRFSV